MAAVGAGGVVEVEGGGGNEAITGAEGVTVSIGLADCVGLAGCGVATDVGVLAMVIGDMGGFAVGAAGGVGVAGGTVGAAGEGRVCGNAAMGLSAGWDDVSFKTGGMPTLFRVVDGGVVLVGAGGTAVAVVLATVPVGAVGGGVGARVAGDGGGVGVTATGVLPVLNDGGNGGGVVTWGGALNIEPVLAGVVVCASLATSLGDGGVPPRADTPDAGTVCD